MEGTSLKYFTGIRGGAASEFRLGLPRKGSPFYVCPAFEEGHAREQISNAPEGTEPDVRIWNEDQSPYERIAQGLRDQSIATGQIGIEETVDSSSQTRSPKQTSQATITGATPVTAGCRMIKALMKSR